VRLLGAEETAARLPYVDLAESIREMALKRTTGEVHPGQDVAAPAAGWRLAGYARLR
jgi:hypothetical protein